MVGRKQTASNPIEAPQQKNQQSPDNECGDNQEKQNHGACVVMFQHARPGVWLN
jgi:hypothetical protein